MNFFFIELETLSYYSNFSEPFRNVCVYVMEINRKYS